MSEVFNDIDPRTTLIANLAFAVGFLSLQQLSVLAIAVSFAVGSCLSVKVPARRLIAGLMALDGLLLLSVGLLPFTVPGQPVFELFGMPLSEEGVIRAMRIALTANGVFLVSLSLSGRLTESALANGLAHLRLPPRLVTLLVLTLRNIDLLGGEYTRMRTALRVRCFQPRADLHSFRSLGYFVGMLLLRSLARAERSAGAMKCRGFDGCLRFDTPPQLAQRDRVMLLTVTIICLAFLLTDQLRWPV